MPGKKARSEEFKGRPDDKAAIPLCRYEELALRENRLRQANAPKR